MSCRTFLSSARNRRYSSAKLMWASHPPKQSNMVSDACAFTWHRRFAPDSAPASLPSGKPSARSARPLSSMSRLNRTSAPSIACATGKSCLPPNGCRRRVNVSVGYGLTDERSSEMDEEMSHEAAAVGPRIRRAQHTMDRRLHCSPSVWSRAGRPHGCVPLVRTARREPAQQTRLDERYGHQPQVASC